MLFISTNLSTKNLKKSLKVIVEGSGLVLLIGLITALLGLKRTLGLWHLLFREIFRPCCFAVSWYYIKYVLEAYHWRLGAFRFSIFIQPSCSTVLDHG